MAIIKKERRFRIHGFTLIELLIVVAIIAILAAIAIPNFLEAQTRSKVSRVKADMRTLATALESYAVDTNCYPSAEINGTLKWLTWITTPIAYITNKDINDPFTPDRYVKINRIATLRYYGFNEEGVLNAYRETGKIFSPRSGDERAHIVWFMLFSHGPDGVRNNLKGYATKFFNTGDRQAMTPFTFDLRSHRNKKLCEILDLGLTGRRFDNRFPLRKCRRH